MIGGLGAGLGLVVSLLGSCLGFVRGSLGASFGLVVAFFSSRSSFVRGCFGALADAMAGAGGGVLGGGAGILHVLFGAGVGGLSERGGQG